MIDCNQRKHWRRKNFGKGIFKHLVAAIYNHKPASPPILESLYFGIIFQLILKFNIEFIASINPHLDPSFPHICLTVCHVLLWRRAELPSWWLLPDDWLRSFWQGQLQGKEVLAGTYQTHLFVKLLQWRCTMWTSKFFKI